MKERDYTQLLREIAAIVVKKGPKATTMDSVASSLSMSKRTLYEIFESKNDMVIRAFDYVMRETEEENKEMFETAPDVITALYRVMVRQGRLLDSIGASFFRDMDSVFSELREFYNYHEDIRRAQMHALYRRGVEEGVFRPGLNFSLIFRMVHVQLESLKRMEEVFPDGITPMEVFDVVSMGFMRSIASRKGIDLLERAEEEMKGKKR